MDLVASEICQRKKLFIDWSQGGTSAERSCAPKLSQRQSITQKGVHAHPLTAREREHGFLQHSLFLIDTKMV